MANTAGRNGTHGVNDDGYDEDGYDESQRAEILEATNRGTGDGRDLADIDPDRGGNALVDDDAADEDEPTDPSR